VCVVDEAAEVVLLIPAALLSLTPAANV